MHVLSLYLAFFAMARQVYRKDEEKANFSVLRLSRQDKWHNLSTSR